MDFSELYRLSGGALLTEDAGNVVDYKDIPQLFSTPTRKEHKYNIPGFEEPLSVDRMKWMLADGRLFRYVEKSVWEMIEYIEIARGNLWHLTDQRDFKLEAMEPEQNYVSISYLDTKGGGIHLTESPNYWREKGYDRPFVAEFHHNFSGKELQERRYKWGREFWIPAAEFGRLKLVGTKPS